MRYADGLTVFFISLAAAVLCEAISWVLIYRTAGYKLLKSSIDKTSKKVESMKAGGGRGLSSSSAAPPSNSALSSSGGASSASRSSSGGGSSSRSRSKKIDRFELSLKDANQSLSLAKFQSGAVVAATLLIVFGLLSSLFDGKPIAKLPFTPWQIFQRISHRGLPGDDPTDCSMAFLYMLCSLSIRPNLQKLLGFSPPRSSQPASAAANSMFGMSESKTK